MTTDNRGNKGIFISGNGKLIADTLAFGNKARAEKTVYQLGNSTEKLSQLRQQIDLLTKLVEQHSSHVQPGVQQAAQALTNEVKQPAPDKSKVLPLLETISSGTKSVSSIASSVAAIVKLVAAVFV